MNRHERIIIVNAIIKEISNRSRRFFHYDGKVAEIIDKGKIYYKSEWGDKELICLSIPDYRSPKGWFHGGTLLSLAKEFKNYIQTGSSIECSGLFSPHWGYDSNDMIAIQQFAKDLGYLK